MMRAWSDVCEGIRCGVKDECRRHTYWLLYEARDDKSPVRRARFEVVQRICINDKMEGFIPLDSESWVSTPYWWELT